VSTARDRKKDDELDNALVASARLVRAIHCTPQKQINAPRAAHGTGEAPDEWSAEAAAAARFGLDEEERKRLAVQEQD
jgi:hypothetical protein